MKERWFFVSISEECTAGFKGISWESLANELRKEIPTFFQFLMSVAAPTR